MIEILILWGHPATQSIAALMGLVAMWQGWKRIEMLRGKKVVFPWKRHVYWGTAALVLWTSGALGFYITLSIFGDVNITGLHATLAWPVIGLSIFGLITGYVMNKHKKKRFWLPVCHGVSNVLLVVLVIVECVTGVGLYRAFLQ